MKPDFSKWWNLGSMWDITKTEEGSSRQKQRKRRRKGCGNMKAEDQIKTDWERKDKGFPEVSHFTHSIHVPFS